MEDDDSQIAIDPGLEAEVENPQTEDQINRLEPSVRMIRRMHQKIQKIQPKAIYNAESWKERLGIVIILKYFQNIAKINIFSYILIATFLHPMYIGGFFKRRFPPDVIGVHLTYDMIFDLLLRMCREFKVIKIYYRWINIFFYFFSE